MKHAGSAVQTAVSPDRSATVSGADRLARHRCSASAAAVSGAVTAGERQEIRRPTRIASREHGL